MECLSLSRVSHNCRREAPTTYRAQRTTGDDVTQPKRRPSQSHTSRIQGTLSSSTSLGHGSCHFAASRNRPSGSRAVLIKGSMLCDTCVTTDEKFSNRT